jgi:hypothetical protein
MSKAPQRRAIRQADLKDLESNIFRYSWQSDSMKKQQAFSYTIYAQTGDTTSCRERCRMYIYTM